MHEQLMKDGAEARAVLLGQQFLLILLLGSGVGLACWPLNRIDRLQADLPGLMPGFHGQAWDRGSLLLALAPLGVMPLVLFLRAGALRDGAGSGITQVMTCLEKPDQAERLMAARPTLSRVALWTMASLALFPLGREGPVAQLGAAVAQSFQRRWSWLLRGLVPAELLAGAAGAGLAGGFNTPLMGVLFMAEELMRRFHARMLWPALLMGGAAAVISNLGGQPMFALGLLSTGTPELAQVGWAIPIGLGAGLLGGVFAWLVLAATKLLMEPVRRRPLGVGLALGLTLVVFSLITGGTSGGDGERLLQLLLDPPQPPSPWGAWLLTLTARLAGPALALGAGVPGGLIDPAFALGGLFGARWMDLWGADPRLGVAVGMAAGLAGATQLSVMTTAFAIRMVGYQALMPGLLAAAVLGAYVGRLVMARPIYHALGAVMLEPRSAMPSEGTAAVKEDEDHGRSGQGDQGQGGEIGNQVEIDAHAASAWKDDVRRES